MLDGNARGLMRCRFGRVQCFAVHHAAINYGNSDLSSSVVEDQGANVQPVENFVGDREGEITSRANGKVCRSDLHHRCAGAEDRAATGWERNEHGAYEK